MKTYGQLVKLVPTNQKYKTKFALYKYKVDKEQQKEKVHQAKRKANTAGAIRSVVTTIETAKSISQTTANQKLLKILRSSPMKVRDSEFKEIFGRVQIKIGLLSCLFEFYAMVFEPMLIFIISFKSFQSGEST